MLTLYYHRPQYHFLDVRYDPKPEELKITPIPIRIDRTRKCHGQDIPQVFLKHCTFASIPATVMLGQEAGDVKRVLLQSPHKTRSLGGGYWYDMLPDPAWRHAYE